MGRYLTDLADVLRAAGLPVIEVPGWKTRGAIVRATTPDGGLIAVTGGLVHHTATPAYRAGDYPSLGIVRDGRSDVPGPLAQLGLGRSGTWYVIAAGRANHSGAVDDVRYSNPQCIGVEAEHPGGSAPWPAEQYASYVRGCAALGKHYRITWRAHKEAAVPYGRKPDPNFDMDTFRRNVLAQQIGAGGEFGVGGGATITPPPTFTPAVPTEVIQERLGLVVDGDYGPVTTAAVKAYQEANGLYPDGEWGPLTEAHYTEDSMSAQDIARITELLEAIQEKVTKTNHAVGRIEAEMQTVDLARVEDKVVKTNHAVGRLDADLQARQADAAAAVVGPDEEA